MWPTLWHNDKIPVKKNMVWQNTIYSITNQDIDLKFLRNINWSMAHIFEQQTFLGNIYLWVQLSIFEEKLGPGHQDDGQHEDPGQDLTQAPLEVQRGYVVHISSQICLVRLLNCI